MHKLFNTVMDYAWGSRTAISELLGQPKSNTPQAELWMGAHPKASSRVELSDGYRTLSELITEEPKQWLGRASQLGAGAAKLPFLFKVLAAETPLSLQAHPTIEQAQAGFAKEDAAGIPLDAPHRNYRDKNHKPELLCALTPFDALCGFRSNDEIRQIFVNNGSMQDVIALLGQDGSTGLKVAFEHLMSAETAQQSRWVEATLQACQSAALPPHLREACDWAHRFNQLYPGDVGVILSLWLNRVHLEPGEAIYLPAGVMHAYLGGTGVELMANSDNVLRGGLTPKHVDVPELLSILRFDATAADKVVPEELSPGFSIYRTPASEFELSLLTVPAEGLKLEVSASPEILLVVEGTLSIDAGDKQLILTQGQSAALRAERAGLRLTGPARVYRSALPHPAG